MDERKQFTFYDSFWNSIQLLAKKDKLPVLEAIITYALFCTEPEGLTNNQLAVFLLVKPVLDSGRKKAASGKQGGKNGKANDKQTESKHQANRKQTEREKEEENEIGKEVEIEGEKDKEQTESAPAHNSGKPFTAFWDAYPKKIDREGAWEAWKALNPSPETADHILSALDAWKKSSQWTEDGDRFIPNAAKFLSQGHWNAAPKPGAGKKEIPWGASGVLGEAELEAIRQVLQEGI